MTIVVPAAPAANPETRVDLSDLVPRREDLIGHGAAWWPPSIADALDGQGVVEVTDERHVVVRDEHANTIEEAIQWLRQVDWDEVEEEARGVEERDDA